MCVGGGGGAAGVGVMALMCDMFHQGYRTVDELRTSGVLCVCVGGGGGRQVWV